MSFFWKKEHIQKNRRKKERISFCFPVKLLVPSLASIRGEGYVEVKAKNLSEGGILVETNRSYPKLVPCKIRIEKDHSHGLVLDGMIIWADENAHVGSWEVGIAFVNMKEEDRISLQQIMHHSK